MNKKKLKTLKQLTCPVTAREIKDIIEVYFRYEITLCETEDLWREFSKTKGFDYWNIYYDMEEGKWEFIKWLTLNGSD